MTRDLKIIEHRSTFPPYRPLGLFTITALTEAGVTLLVTHKAPSPGDWVRPGMQRMLSRKELKATGWMAE